MDTLVDAIDRCLASAKRPIGHHDPCIGAAEQGYIHAALSNLNNDITQSKLGTELAKYCGVTMAVPVSTGTAALQLALMACGVKHGEEVIVPSLTFAATAAAVVHAGAVPHFVDGGTSINAYKLRRHLESITGKSHSKRGRLNVKTGRVISAIVFVDLLGFPADVEQLTAVAREFGMVLIEDAAEALGASVNGKRCGSFGDAAILSFNNNKIVTGGGGGAILTNDEWVAAQAYNLANTCRVQHPYLIEHSGVGFNFRMPTLNAALILAQLEKIDQFLDAKKALHERYVKAVGSMLTVNNRPGEPNYWLNVMLTNKRDLILEKLREKGREIYARALFTPLHKLECYKHYPRQPNLMQAEELFNKAICLPSGKGAMSWT